MRDGALFGILVVLLGINFVAVKISNAGLDPLWGAAVRFAIAAVVLACIATARLTGRPHGAALASAIVYGVLFFAVVYGLMYLSLQHAASGTAAVVFAVMPLLTVLLAAAIGQERLTVRRLAGALLAFAGIAWIFRGSLAVAVPGAALAAIVVSVLAASVSSIMIRQLPRAHPLAMNSVAMAVGAILLALASLAAGETWRAPASLRVWGALAYLVASSATAFVIVVALLGRWRASAVAQQAVLSPLVTVPVALLLVGEVPHLEFVVGGAVALLGVWLGIREDQVRAPPSPVDGAAVQADTGPEEGQGSP